MSVKQDRVAPRTVPDLERKYNWGQRFSEIIGLIDDTRKDVDSTASGLRDEITKQSTAISRNTEQIVMEAQKTTDRFNGIDESVSTLTSQVQAQITAEDVTIAIRNELIDGVNSVKTTTGYKFDEEGLTVSKTGSGLETHITEDGMKVISDTGKDLLTANSKGVDAVDLKASTYLIVGGRSRFENYSPNRTGCFWVGG
jgi:hypothetical protein